MKKPIDNETIAQNLRKIREIKGLRQESVATKLGITTNGYGKIERGETTLSIDRLNQLASVFGVELNDILHLDERVVYHIQNMRNSAPHGTVNNYSLTPKDLHDIHQNMDALQRMIEQQNLLIQILTERIANPKKKND